MPEIQEELKVISFLPYNFYQNLNVVYIVNTR